jgi:ribosomal protection tetracycline resistance protein
MSALAQAGTAVCEPIHRFQLDGPADTLGAVLAALSRFEALPDSPALGVGVVHRSKERSGPLGCTLSTSRFRR